MREGRTGESLWKAAVKTKKQTNAQTYLAKWTNRKPELNEKLFKITSNILNFDGNVVNSAQFDCFLLDGGDKVGSLADVGFSLVWIAGRKFATFAVLL